MLDSAAVQGIKAAVQLAKWAPGRSPEDGPPDEIVESVSWHRPGGEEITDPAEIARLEARAAAQTGREETISWH